ncbi:hypothetical protein PCE1_002732 [Barthelona sp. PCE]
MEINALGVPVPNALPYHVSHSVAHHPSKSLLISTVGSFLTFWDYKKLQIASFSLDGIKVSSIALNPNGTHIAIVGVSKLCPVVLIGRLNRLDALREYNISSMGPCSFSPSGDTVYICSSECSIIEEINVFSSSSTATSTYHLTFNIDSLIRFVCHTNSFLFLFSDRLVLTNRYGEEQITYNSENNTVLKDVLLLFDGYVVLTSKELLFLSCDLAVLFSFQCKRINEYTAIEWRGNELLVGCSDGSLFGFDVSTLKPTWEIDPPAALNAFSLADELQMQPLSKIMCHSDNVVACLHDGFIAVSDTFRKEIIAAAFGPSVNPKACISMDSLIVTTKNALLLYKSVSMRPTIIPISNMSEMCCIDASTRIVACDTTGNIYCVSLDGSSHRVANLQMRHVGQPTIVKASRRYIYVVTTASDLHIIDIMAGFKHVAVLAVDRDLVDILCVDQYVYNTRSSSRDTLLLLYKRQMCVYRVDSSNEIIPVSSYDLDFVAKYITLHPGLPLCIIGGTNCALLIDFNIGNKYIKPFKKQLLNISIDGLGLYFCAVFRDCVEIYELFSGKCVQVFDYSKESCTFYFFWNENSLLLLQILSGGIITYRLSHTVEKAIKKAQEEMIKNPTLLRTLPICWQVATHAITQSIAEPVESELSLTASVHKFLLNAVSIIEEVGLNVDDHHIIRLISYIEDLDLGMHEKEDLLRRTLSDAMALDSPPENYLKLGQLELVDKINPVSVASAMLEHNTDVDDVKKKVNDVIGTCQTTDDTIMELMKLMERPTLVERIRADPSGLISALPSSFSRKEYGVDDVLKMVPSELKLLLNDNELLDFVEDCMDVYNKDVNGRKMEDIVSAAASELLDGVLEPNVVGNISELDDLPDDVKVEIEEFGNGPEEFSEGILLGLAADSYQHLFSQDKVTEEEMKLPMNMLDLASELYDKGFSMDKLGCALGAFCASGLENTDDEKVRNSLIKALSTFDGELTPENFEEVNSMMYDALCAESANTESTSVVIEDSDEADEEKANESEVEGANIEMLQAALDTFPSSITLNANDLPFNIDQLTEMLGETEDMDADEIIAVIAAGIYEMNAPCEELTSAEVLQEKLQEVMSRLKNLDNTVIDEAKDKGILPLLLLDIDSDLISRARSAAEDYGMEQSEGEIRQKAKIIQVFEEDHLGNREDIPKEDIRDLSDACMRVTMSTVPGKELDYSDISNTVQETYSSLPASVIDSLKENNTLPRHLAYLSQKHPKEREFLATLLDSLPKGTVLNDTDMDEMLKFAKSHKVDDPSELPNFHQLLSALQDEEEGDISSIIKQYTDNNSVAKVKRELELEEKRNKLKELVDFDSIGEFDDDDLNMLLEFYDPMAVAAAFKAHPDGDMDMIMAKAGNAQDALTKARGHIRKTGSDIKDDELLEILTIGTKNTSTAGDCALMTTAGIDLRELGFEGEDLEKAMEVIGKSPVSFDYIKKLRDRKFPDDFVNTIVKSALVDFNEKDVSVSAFVDALQQKTEEMLTNECEQRDADPKTVLINFDQTELLFEELFKSEIELKSFQLPSSMGDEEESVRQKLKELDREEANLLIDSLANKPHLYKYLSQIGDISGLSAADIEEKLKNIALDDIRGVVGLESGMNDEELLQLLNEHDPTVISAAIMAENNIQDLKATHNRDLEVDFNTILAKCSEAIDTAPEALKKEYGVDYAHALAATVEPNFLKNEEGISNEVSLNQIDKAFSDVKKFNLNKQLEAKLAGQVIRAGEHGDLLLDALNLIPLGHLSLAAEKGGQIAVESQTAEDIAEVLRRIANGEDLIDVINELRVKYGKEPFVDEAFKVVDMMDELIVQEGFDDDANIEF